MSNVEKPKALYENYANGEKFLFDAYGNFKDIKESDYKYSEKIEKLLIKILKESRYKIEFYGKMDVEFVKRQLQKFLNEHGVFCNLMLSIEMDKQFKYSIAKEYYALLEDYLPFISADVKMGSYLFTYEDVEYYQYFFRNHKDIETFFLYCSKDSAMNLINFAIKENKEEWFEDIAKNISSVNSFTQVEIISILDSMDCGLNLDSPKFRIKNILPSYTSEQINDMEFLEEHIRTEGEGVNFKLRFYGLTPELVSYHFKDILIVCRDVSSWVIIDRNSFTGSIATFFDLWTRMVSIAGMQSANGFDENYRERILKYIIKPIEEVFTSTYSFVTMIKDNYLIAEMFLALMSVNNNAISLHDEICKILKTLIDNEHIRWCSLDKDEREEHSPITYLSTFATKDISNEYMLGQTHETSSILTLYGIIWFEYLYKSDITSKTLYNMIPINNKFTLEHTGFMNALIGITGVDDIFNYTSKYRYSNRAYCIISNPNILKIVRYLVECLTSKNFVKKIKDDNLERKIHESYNKNKEETFLRVTLISLLKLITYLNKNTDSRVSKFELNVTVDEWDVVKNLIILLITELRMPTSNILVKNCIDSFVDYTINYMNCELSLTEIELLIGHELELATPSYAIKYNADITKLLKLVIFNVQTYKQFYVSSDLTASEEYRYRYKFFRSKIVNELLFYVTTEYSHYHAKLFINSLLNAFYDSVITYKSLLPNYVTDGYERYEEEMLAYIRTGVDAFTYFGSVMEIWSNNSYIENLIDIDSLMVGLGYQLYHFVLRHWKSEFVNIWEESKVEFIVDLFSHYIENYWERCLEYLKKSENRWDNKFTFSIRSSKFPHIFDKNNKESGLVFYQPEKLNITDRLIVPTVGFLRVTRSSDYIKRFMTTILQINCNRPKSSVYLFLTSYFKEWVKYLTIKDFIEIESYYEATVKLYKDQLDGNLVREKYVLDILDEARCSILLQQNKYFGYNGNNIVNSMTYWFSRQITEECQSKELTEENAKAIIRFINSVYHRLDSNWERKMELGHNNYVLDMFHLRRAMNSLKKVIMDSPYIELANASSKLVWMQYGRILQNIESVRVNFEEEFKNFKLQMSVNYKEIVKNIRLGEYIDMKETKVFDIMIKLNPNYYNDIGLENFYKENSNIIMLKLPVEFDDGNGKPFKYLYMAIVSPEFYGDNLGEIADLLANSITPELVEKSVNNVGLLVEHMYNTLKSEDSRGLLYFDVEEI